jgi:hypothetical protein
MGPDKYSGAGGYRPLEAIRNDPEILSAHESDQAPVSSLILIVYSQYQELLAR